MFAFSCVSDRVLTLLPPRSLVADAVGIKHTTPAVVLGDVTRLQYLVGQCRYSVALSASDATGILVLRLKNGSSVLGSTTINMDGSVNYAGEFAASINDLQGADSVSLEAEITGAAGAGITFDLGAVLSVTVPLTIGA